MDQILKKTRATKKIFEIEPPAIDCRQVRVIAKRGRTASYVMDDKGLCKEIKKLLDELGWEGFKKAGYLHQLGEEEPVTAID